MKNRRSKKWNQPRKYTRESAAGVITFFIDQQAQADFNQKYPEFVKRLPTLLKLRDCILQLVHSKPDMPVLEVILIALVRMSIEDFRQILLLCANGETTGGMKILRGMFERIVTAKYLHATPDECDAFINYAPISKYKEAMIAKDFGLADEILRALEEEKNAVKSRYMIESCKQCKTTRLNHSWTKIDLPTMAQKAGLKLPMLVGYYFPMQETHATFASIERRVAVDTETQTFTYKGSIDPDETQNTLITSHYLILHSIDILREQFALQESTKGLFEQCLEDYKQIWQQQAFDSQAQ